MWLKTYNVIAADLPRIRDVAPAGSSQRTLRPRRNRETVALDRAEAAARNTADEYPANDVESEDEAVDEYIPDQEESTPANVSGGNTDLGDEELAVTARKMGKGKGRVTTVGQPPLEREAVVGVGKRKTAVMTASGNISA